MILMAARRTSAAFLLAYALSALYNQTVELSAIGRKVTIFPLSDIELHAELVLLDPVSPK